MRAGRTAGHYNKGAAGEVKRTEKVYGGQKEAVVAHGSTSMLPAAGAATSTGSAPMSWLTRRPLCSNSAWSSCGSWCQKKCLADDELNLRTWTRSGVAFANEASPGKMIKSSSTWFVSRFL